MVGWIWWLLFIFIYLTLKWKIMINNKILTWCYYLPIDWLYISSNFHDKFLPLKIISILHINLLQFSQRQTFILISRNRLLHLILHHFAQEFICGDTEYHHNTDNLPSWRLMMEVDQRETNCDDFSCCDYKRYNVLLELLDHSVYEYLTYES